jgi:hypothetical protein
MDNKKWVPSDIWKSASASSLLRSQHTLSLNEHIGFPTIRENVRSSRVKELSSLPKFAPDISKLCVDETIERNSLHQKLYSTNPSAFKR